MGRVSMLRVSIARSSTGRSASASRISVRSGASVGTKGATNPRPWVSAITSRLSSPARRAKVVPWKAGDHADHLRHGEMRARQGLRRGRRCLQVEQVSEVYSTSGQYDLLMKCYLDEKTDIGHFVTSKIQTLAGVKDTFTLITFKAFS